MENTEGIGKLLIILDSLAGWYCNKISYSEMLCLNCKAIILYPKVSTGIRAQLAHRIDKDKCIHHNFVQYFRALPKSLKVLI